ncbi:hypothetical protein HF668_03645 [Acidithiobacillus ferridurans]|nr:hypothetical protein [Acidithiobacillus ferridurans]
MAYDIVSKARELAAQGEAAPQTFVAELDDAIFRNDIPKRQHIERQLLETASITLQLLALHEREAFKRLLADRHLCAHPAFITDDEIFQPTPELVRSHLIHALQYLLIHAPLQGKSAVKQFEADILSASYPVSSPVIAKYLRARYLDRGKDALVVNLIKGIITTPFGSERARFAGKERQLAMSLREIAAAKTAIYDLTVPPFIATRFDVVPDEVLLNLCPYLETDTRIWDWISEPVRIRIKTLLSTEELNKLKAAHAFDAFAIPDLATILLNRFDAFDEATQINIISENPRREFIPRAIDVYRQAWGWRHAEALGRALMIPLANQFAPEDIRSMLEAVAENYEIKTASETSTILETAFELIRSVLNDARPHWQAFVDRLSEEYGSPDHSYAYPEIRAKLSS